MVAFTGGLPRSMFVEIHYGSGLHLRLRTSSAALFSARLSENRSSHGIPACSNPDFLRQSLKGSVTARLILVFVFDDGDDEEVLEAEWDSEGFTAITSKMVCVPYPCGIDRCS